MVLDLVDADIAPLNLNGVNLEAIAIAGARRMVMNSQGTKLLVFSNNYTVGLTGGPLCPGGSSAMTVIDITPLRWSKPPPPEPPPRNLHHHAESACHCMRFR